MSLSSEMIDAEYTISYFSSMRLRTLYAAPCVCASVSMDGACGGV